MGMSRLILFTALAIYLSLALTLGLAMEKTYAVDILTSTGQSVSGGGIFTILFGFGVPNGLIWLNVILVTIPLILIGMILASFILPTVNWGN